MRKVAASLAVGAAFLTGCGDYSGVGDGFSIEGKVSRTTDGSVLLEVAKVHRVEGRAAGKFAVGYIVEVHDNYDEYGKLQGEINVGQEFDAQGQPEALADVHAGEYVLVEGTIRDSTSSTISNLMAERPVYDTLREIAQ